MNETGGFPAHAGMDHGDPPLAADRQRFPRPRGDGPTGVTAVPQQSEVSPPTRGWTLNITERAWYFTGFPAHAGMDLASRWTRKPPTWFPRPRGDGPRHRPLALILTGVSPPTRGWTRRGRGSTDGGGGFPAHAGMDPK